jgi:hypothetical protein
VGRIQGLAAVVGNSGREFGDIEHAESSPGFVAGNTLVERVVASSDIDEG